MIPQKVKEHLEEYINQEVYVQVAIIKGKEKVSTKSAIDKYFNTNHFKDLSEGKPYDHFIDGLKDKTIKFWSIWDNEDLIGCGAIKILGQDYGEFKSIRVHDKFREKGFGKEIISILLSKSRDMGLKKIFIETGSGNFFEPARKLFKSCGFEKCDPFGHYKEDPNSCYYNLNI